MGVVEKKKLHNVRGRFCFFLPLKKKVWKKTSIAVCVCVAVGGGGGGLTDATM